MGCCRELGPVSVVLDPGIVVNGAATCALQFLRTVDFKVEIVQPTLVTNTQLLKSIDFKTDIVTATLTKP